MYMTNLTTHILDTSKGKPAEGMNIKLFKVVESNLIILADVYTNSDGRLDSNLL